MQTKFRELRNAGESRGRRLFVLREHLNLERNRDMTVENYCVLWRWKQARVENKKGQALYR